MKNNGISTILNWALIVGAVALCFAGFKYYNQSKTARNYRGLLAEVNRLQTANQVVSGLVNETLEYSKTHPDIKPLLDAILPKQNGSPAAAPVPTAPKPATK
jgi:hypothetical protein